MHRNRLWVEEEEEEPFETTPSAPLKVKPQQDKASQFSFQTVEQRNENHTKRERQAQHDAQMHQRKEKKMIRQMSRVVALEAQQRAERDREQQRLAEHAKRHNDHKDKKPRDATGEKLLRNAANPQETERELELAAIRSHYLGVKGERRRLQKPSEKFRTVFMFEWDVSEDTTKEDFNSLYANRQEPQLLFGRGFRAGIDVRQQRKKNTFYDALVKKRGETNDPESSQLSAALDLHVDRVQSSTAEFSTRGSHRSVDNEVQVADTHWSKLALEDMTARDWRIFKEDYEITIKGGKAPNPIRYWSESGLPKQLLDTIREHNYKEPTPIQRQAIPIALAGRDLIGVAETGSGKTAAFVLPLLNYLSKLPLLDDEGSQDGPYGLIMAPSRELALQINGEIEKFAFNGIRAVAIVGGRDAEAQAVQLRNGAEVVIGTPGRLRDCLERRYTVLNQANYIILDEADRMVEAGFEDTLRFILGLIPTTNLKDEDEAMALEQALSAVAGHRRWRITQMFSATMPTSVERLTRTYLRAPAHVCIGDPGSGKAGITQVVEFISEGKKHRRLDEAVIAGPRPIMVFVNQKKIADTLAKNICKLGYSATALHGGKAQAVRESALENFRRGDLCVLVATDVAGRGIDVAGIELVINYDMPSTIETYTHRIGRTGRAGAEGQALSFLTEDDSGVFPDLCAYLQTTKCVIPAALARHPVVKEAAQAKLRATKGLK